MAEPQAARTGSQPQVDSSAHNTRVYHASGVDRRYRSESLTVIEVKALLKYQPDFAGRDVLDVGVGTGRTTRYLMPLARRYEGIDYSPVMVERARALLPAASLRHADMRDLSCFESASFDFVFGPNNVLDAVSHDDRIRTLFEWRRVLRDGGLLMFASHNRRYRHAMQGPRLGFSRNPARQAEMLMRLARGVVNHQRVKNLRQVEPDHALLNDEGHDFAILHYYVDPRLQAEQLRSAGFRPVDVFDHTGNVLEPGDPGADSPWLMYVARADR